jgi:hypothetical protein
MAGTRKSKFMEAAQIRTLQERREFTQRDEGANVAASCIIW